MEPYKQLEQEYSRFVGSKYAVTCNSGTSALHLALRALGVSAGDEVIVPEFTMIACAFAVSYCGATPVFIDCKDDLNIDFELIEEKITPRTKAIMPVHIYGRLANMDKIMAIADKHGIFVVEDACEAQGAVFQSRAHITAYSFYKNKIIHAEEGGIATTDDPELAKRMNFLKNMSFGDQHNYIHAEIGFNYRMPDTMATMALRSLEEYPQERDRREVLVRYYDSVFGETPKRDANWVYDMKKQPVIGLQTRDFFKPMSMNPPYLGEYKHLNAYRLSQEGMYICL
jgi:dTDP-4-amino-4,6-dideoxygalactose transaminase